MHIVFPLVFSNRCKILTKFNFLKIETVKMKRRKKKKNDIKMSYEYATHNADWMQNEELSKAHSISDEEPLNLEILSISKALHNLLIFNGIHGTFLFHFACRVFFSYFLFLRKNYLSNHLPIRQCTLFSRSHIPAIFHRHIRSSFIL